jgi:hypothetical protein
MRFKIDGTEVELFFTYGTSPDNRRVTHCTLCFGSDNIVGTVIRNPKESDSKFKARKFALQRALKSFPKEVRKEIWDVYFSKTKIPGKTTVCWDGFL